MKCSTLSRAPVRAQLRFQCLGPYVNLSSLCMWAMLIAENLLFNYASREQGFVEGQEQTCRGSRCTDRQV